MSLIRESLKKVQENQQNDKTTATLIAESKPNGDKKVSTSTYMLVGIGVFLIAGAYLFLYQPEPPKSVAPGGAAVPKPVVVAQASSPATPAQPGPSPSLTSPEPTLKTESKSALKGPASVTGPLSSSVGLPPSLGKSSKGPLSEKLEEASVLGPGSTAAKKTGQGKEGRAKFTVQLKKETGKGLRAKGSAREVRTAARKTGQGKEGRAKFTVQLKKETGKGVRAKGSAREVPAVARMGAGEPQDGGGQEALKQSYQQAYSWQQEGKTAQALSRYREILSQDPYNPYVLTNLGLIHQQTGNLKEAISFYQRAMESDPNFVEAAQNLGVAWLKAGNYEEATRWLERVLSLQPDNASALVNLGILYKRRGNREMARQFLKKAWALNSRLPEASYNLARLEEEAGNIPEAYKYYQQFLQTRNDPNDNLVREVQRHVQHWRVPEPIQK